MGLPVGGDSVPWPPKDTASAYAGYAEHSAWYDGSPLALAAFYGGYGGSQLGGQSLGFFNQNLSYPEPTNLAAPLWRRFMFWSKQPTTPVTRIRIHVPLAADIASTSADLLFSEEPELYIPEAHTAKASPASKASQNRLDQLVDEVGLFTMLIEAAEVAAALGGVFIRVGWDRSLGDFPILTAVHADSAVPEFRWGRMTAVTFWRIVHQEDNKVWRHLERHEPGLVLHGLYKGDVNNLGNVVPLTDVPATRDMVDDLTDGNEIQTGIQGLTAVYVPNMRPNRNDRGSSLGRSDYAGLEGLMDALDETMTSWMRDIRLGRARLIVPKEYLRSEGKGKGAQFDTDREVFTELDMDPTQTRGITENQFTIRTKEHADTAAALVERIVNGAGYSGSTFGLKGEGTIKTATEIAAREQRSLVTRGKKAQYWTRPLMDIVERALQLDHALFNGPVAFRPTIQFSDSVRDDPKEIATTVGLLQAAVSASTETRVRLVHPDWSDDEVNQEVGKILGEAKPAPSALTGLLNQPPLPDGSDNSNSDTSSV